MKKWTIVFGILLIAGIGCKKKGGGSFEDPLTDDTSVSPPTISSTPATSAGVDTAYAYDDDNTVAVSGDGTITFSKVSGPDDFSIDASTGVVSWTPSAEGSFAITIKASNEGGSASQSFTVVVTSDGAPVTDPVTPPAFTSTPALQGVVGQAYAYDDDSTASVSSSEAVTWGTVTAPSGLSIDSASGVISWTPDTVGSFEIALSATNTGGTTTQSFFVTVTPDGDGNPPVITSSADTSVPLNQAYSYDQDGFPTAIGDGPITWSLSVAPTGMTINADTGAITWTPTSSGSEDVILVATNWVSSFSQSFTINVPLPGAPAITSTPTTSGSEGAAYGYDSDGAAEASSDQPFVWSAVSAPAGFSIDANTGAISWVPTVAGDYNIEIEASNSFGSDSQSFTVEVSAAPQVPTITSVANTQTVIGEAYVYNSGTGTGFATASGDAPMTWSVTSGPAGLTINATTGEVAWTPSATGSEDVTIQATNLEGSDSQSFTISVINLPPEIESITPAAAIRDYSQPVVIKGSRFDALVSPSIALNKGVATINLQSVTVVDANTITATMPGSSHSRGTYDLQITHNGGETVDFAKSFIVVGGAGTLHNSDVTGDETWAASGNPHIVSSDIDIIGTLTLDPGVVVMMSTGVGRYMDIGVDSGVGALNADGGTPRQDDPIVFTAHAVATTPSKGDWRGLRFGALLDANNTLLQNVIVEYGGSSTNNGSVDIFSGAAPAMNNVTIRQSADYGIDFGDQSGGQNGIDNISIYDCDSQPIYIYGNYVTTLGDNFDMHDNGVDEIRVVADTINRPNTRFNNYGIPYHTTGSLYISSTTMTIAPGVTIKFAANSELYAGSNGPGALVADGLTGTITLQGENAVAGDWHGVQLSSTAEASLFRNVVIEHFGSGNNGGLEVDTGAESPVVQNSTFRDGTTTAVHLDSGSTLSIFDGNQMVNVPTSVYAYVYDLYSALGNNIYGAKVSAIPSTVNSGSHTWATPRDSLGDPVDIEFADGSTVLRGAHLTIEAGAVFKFHENRYFQVDAQDGYDSLLTVNGTAAEPVTFTAHNSTLNWRGLLIYGNPDGAVSSMDYAIVEHAGGTGSNRSNGSGGVTFSNHGVAEISNSIFRENNGNGLLFYDTCHGNSAFDNNEVHDSEFAAVYIYGDYVGRLGSGNNYHDNNVDGASHDGIRVIGDVVFNDATWPDVGVPYYVTGGNADSATNLYVRGNSTLTLSPGAELYFTDDSRFEIGESGLAGDVVAVGTAVDPIVIGAVNSTAGDWYGIRVFDAAAGTEFEYVTLQHAGGPGAAPSDETASLEIRGTASVRVANSSIINGNSNGVYFQNNADASAGFSDVTISGHRYHSIDIGANEAGTLGTGLTLTGNDTSSDLQEDGIRVRGETVDTDATWAAYGVPYVVTSSNFDDDGVIYIRGADLTIAAGVTVAFAGQASNEAGRIEIAQNGSGASGELIAVGTSGSPIVFTSATSDEVSPFYWRGLEFFENSTDTSRFEYVTIEYGGSRGANYGLVHFYAGSAPQFDNVTLQNSENYAGRWENTAAPGLLNMTYTGNTTGDCIYQNFAPNNCVSP